MDVSRKQAIEAALDAPVAALTVRQALDLVLFLDEATDEELEEVGLPTKVKDL